jgi:hypothetical protein
VLSACRKRFSWFVLCRVAKNEHLKPAQRTRAANFLFLWEEFCRAKFFVRGQTEHPTKPVFYARASVKRKINFNSKKSKKVSKMSYKYYDIPCNFAYNML